MAAKGELATLADLPRIVDIFYSAFHDEFYKPIFPPTPEGREFMQQAYQSFIESDKARVFVVRDDDGKSRDQYKLSRRR